MEPMLRLLVLSDKTPAFLGLQQPGQRWLERYPGLLAIEECQNHGY